MHDFEQKQLRIWQLSLCIYIHVLSVALEIWLTVDWFLTKRHINCFRYYSSHLNKKAGVQGTKH